MPMTTGVGAVSIGAQTPGKTVAVNAGANPGPTPAPPMDFSHPFGGTAPTNIPTPSTTSWFDTAVLHNSFAGNYWWVNTTYGGVNRAANTDPTWSVVMPDYKATAWGRNRSATSFQVHAPAGLTVTSGGGDLQLCLVNQDTGDSLDVFHCSLDSTNHIISHVAADTGTASATGTTSLTDGMKAWATNRWNDGTNRAIVVRGTAWAPIQSNTGTVLTLTSPGWMTVGTTTPTSAPATGAYKIDSPEGWGRADAIAGTGWGIGDGNNPGTRAANAALLVGQLTGDDWTSGVINHGLICAIPAGMLLAEGYPDTTRQVAPATAGEPGGTSGAASGSGFVKIGSKIGIPAGTSMPAALGTTVIDGKLVGKMIWDCLITYGAYVIDVTGGSSQFYADDHTLPTGAWQGIYAHWNNYYGADLAAMDVIKPYLRIADYQP